MGKMKDLTGQRFGRLVAVKALDIRSKHGDLIWSCSCDCGRSVEVRSRQLLYGKTKSCGCLKKENGTKQIKDSHQKNREAASERVLSGNKQCSKCKSFKKLDYFRHDGRSLDKKVSWCKSCYKKYDLSEKGILRRAKQLLKEGGFIVSEIPIELIEARAEIIKIRRKIKEMTK